MARLLLWRWFVCSFGRGWRFGICLEFQHHGGVALAELAGAGGIEVGVVALVLESFGAGEAAVGEAAREVFEFRVDDFGEGVFVDDVLAELAYNDASVGGGEVGAHAG
ncbi:MAG: hypothetical protein JWN40_4894 [Phycisphaerales bacterium]|nr:hypothetical protein [Phycisphaerales bacterium]